MPKNKRNTSSLKFISARYINGLTRKSRSMLWLWIRAGHFPQPIKIGGISAAWTQDQFKQWLMSKGGNCHA
jgi:predicted DNA-binding transcriptional regulator AlpA